MSHSIVLFCLALAPAFLFFSVQARAADRPFPAAKQAGGELRYIAHVPVVIVSGTTAQIGEQVAALGLAPMAGQVRKTFGEWESRPNFQAGWPKLVAAARRMEPKFPADHLAELDAAAKASGIDRDKMLVANVVGDLMKLGE